MDKNMEESYGESPYILTGDNPMKYIDKDGYKKHNWIKENTNSPNDARFNNASFQSRFVNNLVQIWAHGLRELKDKQSWGIGVSVEYYARRKKGSGYYRSRSRDENEIQNAKQLETYLNKYDKNWRKENGTTVIILHSCATSRLAKEFSSSPIFEDVIFIAPNSILQTSRKGNEYVEDVSNGANVSSGRWDVYKNGTPVRNKSGKIITYKNSDQPGTVGFDYKW